MKAFRALLSASFCAVLAIVSIFLLSSAANAAAPCPDDGGGFPRNCTKEIRIWNNTPRKIWVVLQAGQQRHEALNCTVAGKGGGDVWLQAALGITNNCLKVTRDYHVYVNPETGIPPNSFVSIKLPWWSKRTQPADDLYIDWWRGGRVVIFDDKRALNQSYNKLKRNPNLLVDFASGSPRVRCNTMTGNRCKAGELQIYQVPPSAQIGQETPFQLNEFTFADVTAVTNNGSGGGQFIDFNQNYNVSNVDQLYLPIAIEPVREPATVPYMGTTMSVAAFRRKLANFTGADSSRLKWPIYNNPEKNGKKRFPTAGIRVPSALAAFNYYMNPSKFASGEPEMIPARPPALLKRMMDQWTVCTEGTAGCPDKTVYREINKIFLDNYASYISQCTPPAFLAPEAGTNPPRPPLAAYLRYIHGWVPFNNDCPGVPELPTVAAGSKAPLDYINLQYNYLRRPKGRWFNPYTHLVHAPRKEGGLDANAYAFSIDDHSSFQSNDGGSLPGGLIIAVGGAKGLVNGTQMPPPVPEYYRFFYFGVSLGAQTASGGALWAKYGVCSDTADVEFPPSGLGVGFTIGIDPEYHKISASNPCKVTLMDSKNRKYQIIVKMARVPPKAIWPPFVTSPDNNFDRRVMSCPNAAGFVPPAQWCSFTNETATSRAQPGGPIYTLSTRAPLN